MERKTYNVKKKKQTQCFPFCFTVLFFHVMYSKMFPKALEVFISQKKIP